MFVRFAVTLVVLASARFSLAVSPVFVDVTAAAGITHTTHTAAHPMSGGAAAGDLNGDGWVDLFVTRFGQTDLVYLNDGAGGFVDASAAAGFATADFTNGAAMGDIDNDGDLDLYVTRIARQSNLLYINNGAGVFTEEGAARNADVARLGLFPWSFGATFADYDNDGHLDLYTTEWGADTGPFPGETSARLLRNNGDGTFTDATIAAGVYLEGGPPPPRDPDRPGVYAFAPRFADFDRDGHVDLTVASDFGNSRLFWNNGDGTFTDGTVTASVGTDENGMGSAIADYDNDGLLDWFVTSIDDPSDTCSTVDCNWGTTGNRLYKNVGGRSFVDATDAAGVRDGDWGWGATFLDYDNDSLRDLVMTNGIDFGGEPEEFYKTDRSVLWRNTGSGAFADVSNTAGVTDTGDGKNLVSLDYDRDGDQDLFIVNYDGAPILYRNDGGNAGDWLRINVEGTESNRDGLGAVIEVTPDLSDPNTVYYHEVNAGSNYLGHDEKTAHFGVGEQTGPIDRVTITWPASGIVQTLVDVAPNQLLSVSERRVGDYNGDGVVDAADYTVWRDRLGATVPHGDGPDGNGDGAITLADYTHWVNVLAGSSTAIPEPSALVLLVASACWLGSHRTKLS